MFTNQEPMHLCTKNMHLLMKSLCIYTSDLYVFPLQKPLYLYIKCLCIYTKNLCIYTSKAFIFTHQKPLYLCIKSLFIYTYIACVIIHIRKRIFWEDIYTIEFCVYQFVKNADFFKSSKYKCLIRPTIDQRNYLSFGKHLIKITKFLTKYHI